MQIGDECHSLNWLLGDCPSVCSVLCFEVADEHFLKMHCLQLASFTTTGLVSVSSKDDSGLLRYCSGTAEIEQVLSRCLIAGLRDVHVN